MQIVIDIPEEMWERVKKGYVPLGISKHLKNGTPLPKGHGRLKDENEIKQMIEDAKVEYEFSKNFAENIIKFAPTIIEEDEVDKKWRKN